MTACWPWEGRINKDGYGMAYERSTKKYIVAHRMVYTAIKGPIPESMQIDHLCRNRSCVNPSHLEPVTQQENIRRGEGIAVGNARKIFCMRGHPLYGENLGINKAGNRFCRECKKMTSREWHKNNRSKVIKEK